MNIYKFQPRGSSWINEYYIIHDTEEKARADLKEQHPNLETDEKQLFLLETISCEKGTTFMVVA